MAMQCPYWWHWLGGRHLNPWLQSVGVPLFLVIGTNGEQPCLCCTEGGNRNGHIPRMCTDRMNGLCWFCAALPSQCSIASRFTNSWLEGAPWAPVQMPATLAAIPRPAPLATYCVSFPIHLETDALHDVRLAAGVPQHWGVCQLQPRLPGSHSSDCCLLVKGRLSHTLTLPVQLALHKSLAPLKDLYPELCAKIMNPSEYISRSPIG